MFEMLNARIENGLRLCSDKVWEKLLVCFQPPTFFKYRIDELKIVTDHLINVNCNLTHMCLFMLRYSATDQ